jgi:hypothetical protein
MLGVDLTSNPANVEKNRATYIKNMINLGGVNHKRRGLHQIYEYLDSTDIPVKINGLHPCTVNGKSELLIHAGCDFYKENGEKIPSLVEITCKQRCSCFSEEYGCLKENGICGNYVERC